MAFDIDIVFNGIIGACFLAITGTIIYGAVTSDPRTKDGRFFRYVGWVFACFIGTCGMARLSRLVAYFLGLTHTQAVMLVDVTDGISALVGLAAAIAIVGITLVLTRLPKRAE